MTGQELINWIVEHNAQDMQCVVQYRDDSNAYLEPLNRWNEGSISKTPVLASYKAYDAPYDNEVEIKFEIDKPICFDPLCFVL